MTFKRWIRESGLTDSSAKKYSGALFGSISEWAKKAGLIDSNVIDISDPFQFEKLSISIQQLPIFIERNERGNNMYSSALNKYSEYLRSASNELEQDVDNIIKDSSLSETEKLASIKVRVGQGEFRKNLLEYWNGCAVTKYKTPDMLIASHIKPWRNSDNDERIDVFNGLLLTPNIDKAFDAGFITFKKNGAIIISEILESPNQLGIEETMSIATDQNHWRYLEYHQDMVFFNYQFGISK